MPRTRQIMAAAGMAGTVVLAFPAVDAVAVSGTATIIQVIPGGGLLPHHVRGTGCISPGGRANTAELFLRSPNAPTVVPLSPSVFVDTTGTFFGLFSLPADAAIGSTYQLFARCTEEGQTPGPLSAGVTLTVAPPTGPGPPPGPTVPLAPGTVTATTGSTTGAGTTPTTAGSATTGLATPIRAQPRFTG